MTTVEAKEVSEPSSDAKLHADGEEEIAQGVTLGCKSWHEEEKSTKEGRRERKRGINEKDLETDQLKFPKRNLTHDGDLDYNFLIFHFPFH